MTKNGWGRVRKFYTQARKILYSAYEELQRRRVEGIPLHRTTIEWFSEIAEELGVPPLELPD